MDKEFRISQPLKEALDTIDGYGLLGVGCCHVTGEHNPTHFEDGHHVCIEQMAAAFMLIRHLAGKTPRPQSAWSNEDECGWCAHKHLGSKVIEVRQERPENWLAYDLARLNPTPRTIGLTRP